MTDSAIEEVTHVRKGIHNPSDPRHYMRLKPVASTVRIYSKDHLLAETQNAIRVLEVGRDLYDPVFYIPREDVSDGLVPMEGKTTHCPLKGDASYFALSDADAAADIPVAWTYRTAFDFASALNGRLAFYADRVRIEETGPQAG